MKTWGWTLMMICTTLPAGAIGSFGGLITQGFGFNSFQVSYSTSAFTDRSADRCSRPSSCKFQPVSSESLPFSQEYISPTDSR